jgi:hypothetical protein
VLLGVEFKGFELPCKPWKNSVQGTPYKVQGNKVQIQFILFRTDFVHSVCMLYSTRYIEIVKLQSGTFFSFLTLRVFSTLFYALSPVRFSDVMNSLAALVTCAI